MNNAGVVLLEPFLSLKEEDYDNLMGINLRAPLFLAQVVASAMV